LSSYLETTVSIDCLPNGAVVNIDIDFIPFNAILRLRGIGVADRASTSIFLRIDFILSLSFTQNLCSSSITNTHKSLNSTSAESNLCVQTMRSIFQSFNLCNVDLIFFAVSKRVRTQILNGKPEKRDKDFS
jgi:hypothetical protein